MNKLLQTQSKAISLTKAMWTKTFILFFLFGFWQTGMTQSDYNNMPPVIEYQKSHEGGVHIPNEGHDWILEVIEDADFNIVACGYSSETPYGNRRASIIKLSPTLEKQWTLEATQANYYDEDFDLVGTVNLAGFGVFTDIIETDEGYTFIGKTSCATCGVPYLVRPLIMKTDKEGNPISGYPKFLAIDETSGYQYHAISGVYINNEYIVSGYKVYNDVSSPSGRYKIFWLAKFDNDFTTMLYENDLGGIDGEFHFINLSYPNGTKPDGKPVLNEAPDGFVVVGTWGLHDYLVYSGLNPLTHYSSDVFIFKGNISDLSEISSTSFSSDISTVYNFNFPKNNGTVCNSIVSDRTNSSDYGYDIIQLQNGNYAVTALLNKYILRGDQWSCVSNNGMKELRDADAFVLLYDIDLNPVNFPNESVNYKHVELSSAQDCKLRVREDHEGGLVVFTSTTDGVRFPVIQGGVKQAYLITRLEPTNYDYDWRKVALGKGNTGICCFAGCITSIGRIIAAGDNYTYNSSSSYYDEDYDFIRLGKRCVQDISYNLLPNMPNGIDYSIKKVLDDIQSPGTILNWGASRKIKARIYIENGYTLRILGGMGLTIEFAPVGESFDLAYETGFSHNIFVESGGKLIIEDGVTLTAISENDCECVWDGILVQQSVSSNPPGKLEMWEATIENSKIAITAENSAEIKIFPKYGLSSGRPQFLNNRRSIAFLEDNGNNASQIWYTDFIWDRLGIEYNGRIAMGAHVTMWNTGDIPFWGCGFYNNYTGNNILDNIRGQGIGTFDASYIVSKGFDIVNTLPCKHPNMAAASSVFSGLGMGVTSGFTMNSGYYPLPYKRIKILESRFNNITHSVRFSGYGGMVLYGNTFKYDNDIRGANEWFIGNENTTFGVSTDQSSEVQLLENKFDCSSENVNFFYHFSFWGENDGTTFPGHALYKNHFNNSNSNTYSSYWATGISL